MIGTRLTTVGPFDGAGIMRYLAGHAIPGVEFGDDAHYERLIRLTTSGEWFRFEGSPRSPVQKAMGRLAVALDGEDAVVATLDGSALPGHLVPMVRRLFSLDADSRSIDAVLATDPALTDSVRTHPGIRLPGSVDSQEQLLRTMIGQQISIAAARTVLGRLSRELDGSGLFPTAQQFAKRGPGVLRGPERRMTALLAAATALADGSLVLHSELTVEELKSRLVALSGVGPWTAGYVAMRTVGAQDILLASDLVLLKGARRLGLPSTPKAITEYAVRWAPYRSYAGMHLWRNARS